MNADPHVRFLGIPATNDVYRLLALTPGQQNRTAIERALQSQLMRVARHPEGKTPQGLAMQQRLREAAAYLLGTPAPAAPSSTPAPSPPARSPSAHPAAPTTAPSLQSVPQQQTQQQQRRTFPTQSGNRLQLTPFDRSVLAILVAYGGWNAESRARLVALAAAHNVSPTGLMTVVSGLNNYARAGGTRFDVGSITQGASRFENLPELNPRSNEQPAGNGSAITTLAPEFHEGGTWATIKLSMLFGTITIILGVFFVKLLTQDRSGPAPAPIADAQPLPAPNLPQVAARGNSDSATDGTSTFTETLRNPFTELLSFKGTEIPDTSAAALDQSPRLPDLFDELSRKLAVNATPSAASMQDWRYLNEQASIAWPLADAPTVGAIRAEFFDVLSAVSGQPSVLDEFIRIFQSPALSIDDPLDVWRGAWIAGMLGETASRIDLAASLRESARAAHDALFKQHIPEDAIGAAHSARTWLNEAATKLIAETPYDAIAFDRWELWITAQRVVERNNPTAFSLAMFDAAVAILHEPHDLSHNGPLTHVLGRLLSEVDFTNTPTLRDRVFALFDDASISNQSLRSLSGLLVHAPNAPWFTADMLISARPDPARTRDVVRLLGQRWPAAERPATQHQGAAIAVNDALGRKWRDLVGKQLTAARDLKQPTQLEPLALAHRLIELVWLSEAAAALAANDVTAADTALHRAENGWQYVAILQQQRQPFAPPPQQPGQPATPTGPSTPLGTGGGNQLSSADGVWTAAYQAARRNSGEQMTLLTQLRQSNATDLGPIDARALVTEAYGSPAQELRETAQSIILEIFARGPNITLAMLDHFVEVGNRSSAGDFIETFLGGRLPDVRDPDWRRTVRLRLLRRALETNIEKGDELNAIAKLIADSAATQHSMIGQRGNAAVSSPSAADTAESLLAVALGERASTLTAATAVPHTWPIINRRAATRNMLATGPLERFVSAQVAVVETLCYITVAEQPTTAARAAAILEEASSARARSPRVLEQAVYTELAILRIWLLRIAPENADRNAHLPSPAHGRKSLARPRIIAQDDSATSSRWKLRLEALTPSDPEAYFLLAEEVADAAADDNERDLARHLFSLAAVLDPARLGNSAALALADLARDRTEKRAFLALAELMAQRRSEPDWSLKSVSTATTIDAGAAFELSEALSHYRLGQGARAERTLANDTPAAQLLDRFGDSIGGANRIRENLRHYRSGISPIKTHNELITMLRFEIALLEASEGLSWSSDLLLHRGQPLIEVDPSSLEETLHVDPTRNLYRNGRWVSE
ncbi:MAG: hypothetical protein ACR2GY_05795 [Phycisphaerales bacterium]